MNTNIPKVVCDVDSCVYNLNGEICNKGAIKISKGDENDNEHFCKSYENCCGFRKE